MGEKYLGLPPDEQDAVHDWLVANGVCKSNAKDWGAYISKVPAEIVGPYCVGDVLRTLQLFKQFRERVTSAKMGVAYDREMRLIPVMLENTLAGIAVDIAGLTRDCAMYETALTDIEALLFQELDATPFNIDSDAELADMIDRAHPGLQWELTATGKRSTSKANMEKTLSGIDGKLGAILQYRASVATCLNTFMKVWLKQAVEGDGRMRCQWNTTRSDKAGARTGRLSSTPNFMNIPTLESAKFARAIALRAEFLPQFPELPNVRRYLVADDAGSVLLDRDFAGQELRVMAHFEDGVALQAYKDNPQLDLHQLTADMINRDLGLGITRKQTKSCSFAILYGSGLTTLAATMGSTYDEAGQIKTAYLAALPGVAGLLAMLKGRARDNLPFRTWGGRVYHCEEPKFMEGRWRTFDYKMVNYLVQGSSADITKEAMLRYHAAKKHGRIILCVHDEIVVSCPKQYWREEMEILKACMGGIELDAPLITDGEVGSNLFELTAEADYAQ
jgi:DNA polymerase I-like protein with 3'-5' exonuclease and polymerase domains